MEAKSVIICPHCGKATTLSSSYGTKGGLSERAVIDTEHPIRCPECRRRLNHSAQNFLSQLQLRVMAG